MNASDIIAILGLIGSFIGIPITFIVARRAPQRPDLRFATDFDVLLMPSDSLFKRGLRMALGNRNINRISRTRVAIWNNGDEIKKTDIVEGDPLRIVFGSDDHILQWRVISVSREQIALKSTVDPNSHSSLLVDFEFLDAGDGGVIEVVHQGLKAPLITGTVRRSKVKSSGSVGLDPNALAAVAGKSLPYRIWKRTAGGIVAWLVFIGVITYWAVVYVITPLYLSRAEQLINPKNYDLNTAAGQAEFVHSVINTNYYNDISNSALSFAVTNKSLTLVFIILLIALIVIVPIYLIYTSATKIPADIALHRYPEDTSGEKGHDLSSRSMLPEDGASPPVESHAEPTQS